MGFIAFLLLGCIVLLVIFIAKVSKLSTKLSNLEYDVRKIGNRTDDFGQGVFDEPKTGEKKATIPQPSPIPNAPVSAAATVSPLPKTHQIPVPMPPKPSRTREEWESLIGGKILNRIGALALIIGIGFFLKYAFDNNWISETVRVLIGVFVGFLCLAGAYRSHQKGFQVFAQGIVGAGISILYLSVYASFNFYSLVPQWMAFILMSFVTVLALVQGLYYGSIAVALLGWAGGFLTPILLSTGVANEIGLFSYIALLDAGLLAIVYNKERWWVIETLAFAGTWILYLSWYTEYYTPADLSATIFFVLLFWGVFHFIQMAKPSLPEPGMAFRRIVAGANALFLYLALFNIVDKDYHSVTGGMTLCLGILYFATFIVVSQKRELSKSEQVDLWLTSIAFLVVATANQFSGFEVALAWSVEACALIWLASRRDLRSVWLAAVGIYGLALLRFVSTRDSLFYLSIDEFSLMTNLRAITLVVSAVSLFLSARFLDQRSRPLDSWIVSVFRVLWPLALFMIIGLETNDYFRQRMAFATGDKLEMYSFERLLWTGTLWAALSTPLVWIGLRLKQKPVLISGLIALLIGGGLTLVRGISFDPIELFTPVANMRAASLIIVTGLLLLHERFIESRSAYLDWLPDIRSAIHIAIVVVVLGLLTGEIRDLFQNYKSVVPQSEAAELQRLSNLQQLSLSAAWLFYSGILMAVGLWRKLRGLRVASFVVFGITILKIFLYDLSFLDTLYRIFSFIALGLVLLAVSFAYQRYRDVIFGARGEGV